MEDNSNEILTLLAKDELAIHMVNHPHNKDRYQPPEWKCDYSRQSTPSCTEDEESQPLGSSLKLTFETIPKNARLGYTFGRDPSKCDILLPRRDISNVHFRVKFSSEGQLLLIDESSFGSWVSINDQRNSHPRHHFTWILSPDIKTIKIDFGDKHTPSFELKVPRHTNLQAYQEKLAIFLKMSRDAGPSLGSLVLDSPDATAQPSRAISPRRRPWYLKESEIGSGQYGVVYKARDMSTNKLYAIKELRQRRADMADNVRCREIDIMESLPHHPHVVHFVESCDGIPLQLVMEYLPRGNLIDEERNGGPISMEECVLLLRQGLQALEHLHSHDYTHRDIKPQNILVDSRTPFHVKLADFGLSQCSSALLTFCGTVGYVAPELAKAAMERKEYTSAIDVWALGVVVFQFVDRPINPHSKRRVTVEGTITDAKRIIAAVNDCESDQLTDLLRTGMLIADQRKRLSATECLKQASQIPNEAFRLQVTRHQAQKSDSLTLVQGSLRRSRSVTHDSDNNLRAHKIVRVKPSAAETLQQSMYRLRSIPKPRRPMVIKLDHIETAVEGITISMRKSDNSFNASQFLALFNTKADKVYTLEDLQLSEKSTQKNSKTSNVAQSWLSFKYVEDICEAYDLETVLEPLLDYGNGYFASQFRADVVMIRHNHKAGFMVNATHLFKIAKESRRSTKVETRFTIRDGPVRYQGDYCSVPEALRWCQSYRLLKLSSCLRKTVKDHSGN